MLAARSLKEAESEETGAQTPEEELDNAVMAEMEKRKHLPNVSTFAFTATPKPKTLELFGNKQPDGSFAPFHLYSMRQAIEEGFIRDVLESYTTYKVYWRLIKKIEEDPHYDRSKADYLLRSFVDLHPHAIEQKVRVMVDHFSAVQDRGPSPETRPGAVPLPAQGHRDEDVGQRLHGAHVWEQAVSERSTVLLEHHLKELKLPTFLREYGKVAGQCAAEGVDHPGYLLRLSELELIDRHHRMVDRRIKAARFPATKSLDTFDFLAMPSVNKHLAMQLARCEYIDRRENVIAVGNSGTGKTHVALGLGLAACQRGLSVGFTTAASLVHELIEARDERRLLNLQKKLARLKLLIVDELGFVPLSKTGAELLFEVFSQRYERGSVLVTTNLPFDEWTEVFGSERLTGALLDRLTHRVHILEMNGESYRLKQSRQAVTTRSASDSPDA